MYHSVDHASSPMMSFQDWMDMLRWSYGESYNSAPSNVHLDAMLEKILPDMDPGLMKQLKRCVYPYSYISLRIHTMS